MTGGGENDKQTEVEQTLYTMLRNPNFTLQAQESQAKEIHNQPLRRKVTLQTVQYGAEQERPRAGNQFRGSCR